MTGPAGSLPMGVRTVDDKASDTLVVVSDEGFWTGSSTLPHLHQFPSCGTIRAMRFRTTLLQSGKTATGFEVPTEIVEALGQGKRPPVKVTINGYTYRNTVAVMGGVYMVGVSAEHRAGASVAGGDEIDVDLELDTAPRELIVPADLAAALDAEPAARSAFDGLSFSNRQWHVLNVEGTKNPETRQRRIEKAVEQLREGRT